MATADLNTPWAQLFVEELARAGLRAVSIAPGSRSTPLTLAFERHPLVEVQLHLDERSAAFFALGRAQATDAPVALVCTSGTAAANFLPAIVEAAQAEIPLLVLTADRPPELRHSGANQTIDQIKMFGDFVLWSVDVALPEAEPPAVAVRNLRALAGRAYNRANGLVKGAVHLNFPFRKPLEPTAALAGDPAPARPPREGPGQRPHTQFWHGRLRPTEDQLEFLGGLLQRYRRGLIVCGPRCPGNGFAAAVVELAQASGYPVLADPLSGVRFGGHVMDAAGGPSPVYGGYDTFLRARPAAWATAEVVIRFGAVPTSKVLNQYLDGLAARHVIQVGQSGRWRDADHRTSDFVEAEPWAVCQALAERIGRRADGWASAVAEIETLCWQEMAATLNRQFFDGAAVAAVVASMPAGGTLFAASSLPIRHVDEYGRPRPQELRCLGNRGASGIDGTISSALGASSASSGQTALICGDIAFYHDANGLFSLGQGDLKLTIVLLNNNGGGIFRRLPIARYEPEFTRLFLTPHGLEFEPLARMYGLDYRRPTDSASLQQVFADSMNKNGSTLIEVRTDSLRDLEIRQEISDHIVATLPGGR